MSTTATTTTCSEFYCVNLPLACVVICQFRSKKYVGAEKMISEWELATLAFIIWWKQHNIAAEQHNFALILSLCLVGQHILSQTHCPGCVIVLLWPMLFGGPFDRHDFRIAFPNWQAVQLGIRQSTDLLGKFPVLASHGSQVTER